MPGLNSRDLARAQANAETADEKPLAGLHLRTAQRLKEMIITGKIPAGSTLPEIELSASLGVSRTPLREALKLLVGDGLVELRQNRSARVPDWEPDQMVEIFEALAGLEKLGTELAATRMTEEELARLPVLQDQMNAFYEAGDLPAYFEVNLGMHNFIMECARNRPLAEAHGSVQPRAHWAVLRVLATQKRWRQASREHIGIIAALNARDPEEAGRLAYDHCFKAGMTIVEVLREVLAEAVEKRWRSESDVPSRL